MVESQKVPANYVKATVTTSLQDRLQTIEQQITNRSNLERIIREVGLYPELVEAGQTGAAVSRVRQDLTLQVQGNRVFRIFFKAPDPQSGRDHREYRRSVFHRREPAHPRESGAEHLGLPRERARERPRRAWKSRRRRWRASG